MKNSKGFTLVETVIALSVTSVLIFIIINFMTNSIVQYARTEARAQLLNEAQAGLDVIGRDIILSGNADTNNRWPDQNAPGAPDDLYNWASDEDTLLLATAVEDTNGSIVFADPALYISEKNNNIYFLNNGTLYKRTVIAPVANNSEVTTCPAGATSPSCPEDRKILSNVANFDIRYFNDKDEEVTPTNARSVELYVKLDRPIYGQSVSVDYTTRMVFRND